MATTAKYIHIVLLKYQDYMYYHSYERSWYNIIIINLYVYYGIIS
jgi:hypothetical protein